MPIVIDGDSEFAGVLARIGDIARSADYGAVAADLDRDECKLLIPDRTHRALQHAWRDILERRHEPHVARFVGQLVKRRLQRVFIAGLDRSQHQTPAIAQRNESGRIVMV